MFGKPIFTYSYREAAVDGYLVDQEPPIRITTQLARDGIHFVKEEEVEFVHAPTGQLELFKLPDAIEFEVEQFNKTVVTQDFNRVAAEETRRPCARTNQLALLSDRNTPKCNTRCKQRSRREALLAFEFRPL
jgi:type I site-specific restriction endonuclease